jgi:hypothetical protein
MLQGAVLSQDERELRFEAEGVVCSLSERGEADDAIPTLLQDASSLSGVILVTSAADSINSKFLMQIELLSALSLPLLAIVLVGAERAKESLSMIEQSLFRELRQSGVMSDNFLLLAYSPETQAEVAAKLFHAIGQHVLLATPPSTKDSLPLQIMLRARRQMIDGKEHALASLMQGTVSVGDSIVTDTVWSGAQVTSLRGAYDLKTPLQSIRADDEPQEIFLAIRETWWRGASMGQMLTHAKELPRASRCQALLYLPASCTHEIDAKRLTKIDITWSMSNQRETVSVKLLTKKSLRPGAFALAQISAMNSNQLVVQGSFFTWIPPFAQLDTRAEGVGRIIQEAL